MFNFTPNFTVLIDDDLLLYNEAVYPFTYFHEIIYCLRNSVGELVHSR